jgi:predicted enzyme related to lactoylglutathione lyase
METPALMLAQITLAAENVAAMVAFYDALFGAELQPAAAFGTTVYRGRLHGVPFLICPNAVAGVEATQSRHQHTYQAQDLARVVELALRAGGQVVQHDAAGATVLDPDGNTLVFAGGA